MPATNQNYYFSCRYILDDVDRHWNYHDKDKEYQDTSYGVIEGQPTNYSGCGLYLCGCHADKESMYDEHRKLTYNQVIARDEKRFKVADRDGDQKLGREEYADFLHPGKIFSCPTKIIINLMAMIIILYNIIHCF